MSKDETVIVIRSLVPGGVAAWDGRIVPGDRLMFVNNVDLSHASLDEAVQVEFSIPSKRLGHKPTDLHQKWFRGVFTKFQRTFHENGTQFTFSKI